MNFQKVIFMLMLLMVSIVPAPAVNAGIAPMSVLDVNVAGAQLNTDFTISVVIADADDYVTKIALGEAPYKTQDYNVVNCDSNVNTCEATFTVGKGQLSQISEAGEHNFKVMAKNSNGQYLQYNIQVSVSSNNNIYFRTAAVDGNALSQSTYNYLPSTISVHDAVSTTDDFVTLQVPADIPIGVNYNPDSSSYSQDSVSFYFDQRLTSIAGEGETFTSTTAHGDAITSCALNWASNNYDCTLNYDGGDLSFELIKAEDGTYVRYFKPLYAAESPVINFADATFSINEGAALTVDLSQYIFNVDTQVISLPALSWATTSIDQASETITVTPNTGAVGSFSIPVTVSVGDVSDTDYLAITVLDAGNDAPVITSSLPQSNTITLQEESGVYNFAVAGFDPDNTLLSYIWEVTSIVAQNSDSNQFAWTIPEANGADDTEVISVDVVDQDGSSNSVSWTVTILDDTPSATLAAMSAINEGENSTFDASSSSMSFGTDSITNYEFDIDGTSVYSGASSTFTQTFTQNGSYDVTVTVTDDDGSSDSTTQTIVVNNVPITNVTIVSNVTSLIEPANVTYTCSAVGGNLPYTYNITQNGVQLVNTNETATAVDLVNGTYTYACEVTDVDGDVLSSATSNFTIADAAPSANYTFVPTSIVAGGVIEFTSTSTTPIDAIVSNTWSVNDTTNVTIDNSSASATNITFGNAGTYDITLDIVDSDGSTDSITQSVVVAVNDTQDPTLNGSIVITPSTLYEGDNATLSIVATDDVSVVSAVFNLTDSNNVSVIQNAVLGSNDTWSTVFANLTQGNYTIDLVVTDFVGKTVNATANLTVLAPIVTGNAPVVNITSPVNGTVVNDTDLVSFSVNSTDVEDGDLTANVTLSSDIDGALVLVNNTLTAGNHTITATVTDLDNNTVTDSIMIEVLNTTIVTGNAPVVNITSPVNGTVVNDTDLVSFSVNSTDVEDGDLTANVTLSSDIDGALVLVNNTLTAGNHTITASVTDSNNNTVTDSIMIEVLNTTIIVNNTAPVVDAVANQSATVGVAYTYTFNATDAQNDTITYSINSSLGSLNSSTGVWTYTPSLGDEGNYVIEVSANDGELNGTTTFNLEVLANSAPVITSVNSTYTVTEGNSINFTIQSTDDENETVTYSNNASSVLLGSGITFNSSTGYFQYDTVFDEFHEDTNVTFQIVATDTQGNTDVQNVTLEIIHVNQAPVFDVYSGNTLFGENQTFQITVSATDIDANDTLSYALQSIAPTSNSTPVMNSSTGVLDWTTNFADAGNYTITFNVTDGVLSANQSINIEIADNSTVPQANATGNGNSTVTGIEPLLINFQGTWTDGESPFTTEWFINGAPVSSTVNFNDTFAAGNYNVTFVVTDVDGESTNDTVAVTVQSQTHNVELTGFSLNNDSTYWIGDSVQANATVQNLGNIDETVNVTLYVDGVAVNTSSVNVNSGSSQAVSLDSSAINTATGHTVELRASVSGDTAHQFGVVNFESVNDALNTYEVIVFPNPVVNNTQTTAYLVLQNAYLHKGFTELNVQLTVDGSVVDSTTVDFNPGQGKWIEFNLTRTTGNYTVGAILGNSELNAISDVMEVTP